MSDLKKNGIYKITNLINNKIYIGSAGGKYGFEHRFNCHKWTLNNNEHGNDYLQKSWNKYGKEKFKFEILEIIEDKSKILEREQYYLDLYKSYNRTIGYNICKIAGSSLGVKRTDEFKKKISEYGLNMPQETKDKIGKTLTGRKQSQETINKRVEKLKGKVSPMKDKKHNKETLNKMSISHKLNKNTKYFPKGNIPHNIKEIIQLDLNYNIIKTWTSAVEAGKDLKINSRNISSVCRNERKTAGGFKWKYIN